MRIAGFRGSLGVNFKQFSSFVPNFFGRFLLRLTPTIRAQSIGSDEFWIASRITTQHAQIGHWNIEFCPVGILDGHEFIGVVTQGDQLETLIAANPVIEVDDWITDR